MFPSYDPLFRMSVFAVTIATFFIINEAGSIVLNKTAHLSRNADIGDYLHTALYGTIFLWDEKNPLSMRSLAITIPSAALFGYMSSQTEAHYAGIKWDEDQSTITSMALAVVGIVVAQALTSYFYFDT